jgi:hypothetical protein
MGTPSFSPCLRGSKKKDGLIEPRMQDPNQLLDSSVQACFPQIQYNHLVAINLFTVRLPQAFLRLEKLANGWRWGFVWFGAPHHRVFWAVLL